MKKVLLATVSLFLILSIFFNTVSCAKRKVPNANAQEGTTEKKTDIEDITETKKTETTENSYLNNEKNNYTTEEITDKTVESTIQKTLKFTSFGNGTCSVSGIGNCVDLCVIIPEKSPDGDVVTSIDEKAFFGNTEIKTVQIPSTISRIGNCAFGGCSSLVYISVDGGNKSFCDIDGVLYSYDMTTLIHYPAASGASELEISIKIKTISDMAFYDCPTLKTIYYDGNLANWGRIDIGDMNYGLFTASISCTGSEK